MKNINFKALTCAVLMATLAACSSATKNNTASNTNGGTADRAPAQSQAVQQIVSVFQQSSGMTSQEVESMLIKNLTSAGILSAGTTYQMVLTNPALAQKFANAILTGVQKKNSQMVKTFKVTNLNSTVASITKAKTEIASLAKIEKAKGQGGLKADGSISFFGDDTVQLYNSIPEDLKAAARVRINHWAQIAKDMPGKKDKIDRFVDNGLMFIKKAGVDWQGTLDCAEWGDMRQDKAIDNAEINSIDMLKVAEPGRTLASYEPAFVESGAKVTGLSAETFRTENAVDLRETCGYTAKGLKP